MPSCFLHKGSLGPLHNSIYMKFIGATCLSKELVGRLMKKEKTRSRV